jgi:dTDP-4-amino-4,6-dideoxygalactose transaminase
MNMNRNSDFIPFARPDLGEEEEAAVIRVLRSGWLTTGREARSFEEEMQQYTGSPYCRAVNSATAGLHLALEALGVSAGDRVITSCYTFAATAEVIRYLGADPVFVDIERDSFNLDVEQLAYIMRMSKKNIRAIIPVHIGGYPCRMKDLREISKAKAVPIIEDAAHAFPVREGASFLGTQSDCGVYSFYANKTITTGEGGMVLCADEGIARRISCMRLHGIDRDVWERYRSEKPSWYYNIVDAGYKYNLSDLCAAIGRVQLTKAEHFKKKRAEIAERYMARLGEKDYLHLPPRGSDNAWHLFILRIIPDRLRIGRDEFITELAAHGIGTSVHYIPLHLMDYYRKRYNFKPDDFPEAVAKYQSAISIPIYSSMTDEEVTRVIEAVCKIGDGHYKGGIP